jgi:hypothetical protein
MLSREVKEWHNRRLKKGSFRQSPCFSCCICSNIVYTQLSIYAKTETTQGNNKQRSHLNKNLKELQEETRAKVRQKKFTGCCMIGTRNCKLPCSLCCCQWARHLAYVTVLLFKTPQVLQREAQTKSPLDDTGIYICVCV